MTRGPLRPEEAALLREALRGRGAADVDAGPCPAPGLLAGLAEGRLLDAEREAVLRHAAACEDCCALLAEAAADDASAVATRGRRWAWIAAPLAAAAVVLLAFTLFREREPERRVDVDATLVAASKDLAAASPDLFGKFWPLGHGERVEARRLQVRGGFRLLQPIGPVLDERPSFRWEPDPEASAYRLRVTRADRRTVLFERTVAAPEAAYPPDAPAPPPDEDCVWTVTTEGALGPTEETGAFRVVTEDARQTLRRKYAAIEARAPRDLVALLEAHVAIRAGLLAEAERIVRARLKEVPSDAAARETLFHVLRKMGASEAEGMGIAPKPADGG